METYLLLTCDTPIAIGVVNGMVMAVWTYRLAWKSPPNQQAPFPETSRVALQLSAKLDLRETTDDGSHPGRPHTFIERHPEMGVQYVVRKMASDEKSPLVFTFVAPSAEDQYSPVKLAVEFPTELDFTSIPFATTGDDSLSTQQIITAPAMVCPAAQPTASDASARHVEKATLVSLDVPVLPTTGGGAVVKRSYVLQLGLRPGEVDAVTKLASQQKTEKPRTQGAGASEEGLLRLLKRFEDPLLPVLIPDASNFKDVPPSSLLEFGQLLIRVRTTEALKDKGATSTPTEGSAADAEFTQPLNPVTTLSEGSIPLGNLNSAVAATKQFDYSINSVRVGLINLERIEMTPAGIQRGELLATIPLAPGEKTSVVQKEWSVTTKEFTSIVTDSLENISETGVTDNTELSQSTTNQIQHSNQFNITGTVTGRIPLISSASAQSSFGAQDSTSQSATDSTKHATAVTQKASSRAKQEHKVTISTTTVTGTSETTTRELQNNTADPIRVDYFSMMRKWQVRLYRYGLRLTYDIVIPAPAGLLRRAYAELDDLRAKQRPFSFPVLHSAIRVDDDNYKRLGDQYQTQVSDPPAQTDIMALGGKVPGLDGNVNGYEISINVREGYEIASVTLDGHASAQAHKGINLTVVGALPEPRSNADNGPIPTTHLFADGKNLLEGAVGSQVVNFAISNADFMIITLTVKLKATSHANEQWRDSTWNALYTAAQNMYYAEQQDIATRISALEDKLSNVDTLTLRREESDEIMRNVLKFILGRGFDFMPDAVSIAVDDAGSDLKHGVEFTTNRLGLLVEQLAAVRQYEEEVRFINQAIEWENVVTFLYSYFWDIYESWDFIRQIKHNDATRQAFLRAGAARVVLTVRKGWERAWVQFAEGGFQNPAAIPTDHPYLTIAQETAAYDDRNYPGIPPANPASGENSVKDAVYTTLTAEVHGPSLAEVELEVESSIGFHVGAQLVIGSRVDANSHPQNTISKQESQVVTGRRDDRHVTVGGLSNSHISGELVFQPGEKGTLIAEWNEYTPSSGTDIAMTSNLTQVS